jgi:hypothetical protein
MIILKILIRYLITLLKELRWVTGGCCQWRDSGLFDSEVVIETSVLRRKFSGEIATEQQPPKRYGQVKQKKQDGLRKPKG